MENTVVTWEYVALLEEEGYTEKELPKELRNRIQGLKLEAGRLKNKPDEAKSNALKEKDIKLANDILNWIEEGLDTEEEYLAKQAKLKEEEEAKNNPPAPKTPTAEEVEAQRKADEEAENKRKEEAEQEAQRLKEEEQKQAAANSPEGRILAKTEDHPRKWISTEDLAAIIGKQPGYSLKVGSLNLEKVNFPVPKPFYYID